MNLIDYTFSKLYFYYGKEYGVMSPIIVMVGCVIFNFMTIIFLLSSIGIFELMETDIHRSMMFRLVVGPLIVIIISMPFFRYFNKNDYYKTINSNYERLDETQRKKMNIKFFAYMVMSFIMLFVSIISPLFGS